MKILMLEIAQANSRRQPVILTNEEKIKIDKEYPGSYDIALPYSVDKNKQFGIFAPDIGVCKQMLH